MFDGLANLLFGKKEEKKQQKPSPVRVVQQAPRPLSMQAQQHRSPVTVRQAPKPVQPKQDFKFDPVGFVRDAVVKPVADSAHTIGNAYASGLSYAGKQISGENDRNRREMNQRNAEAMKQRFQASQIRTGTPLAPNTQQANKARQTQLQRQAKGNDNLAQTLRVNAARDRLDVRTNADPLKTWAASVNLGATVAAPGMSRAAAPIINALNPIVRAPVAKFVGNAVAQAPVGTVIGATGQLEKTGGQTKAEDLLSASGSGALAGGLLGGAIPVAADLVKPGVRAYANAANKIVDRPAPVLPQRLAGQAGFAQVPSTKSVQPRDPNTLPQKVWPLAKVAGNYKTAGGFERNASKLIDQDPALRQIASDVGDLQNFHALTKASPAVKDIPVKGGKSKVQKFVSVNTLDNNGKATFDLIPLDSKRHTVSNGMVTDKQGRPVGSYLGINDRGQMEAYIEGRPVNIGGVLGDLDQWGNMNKSSWDMNRLIEANAPNARTARKVQDFTTGYKDKQEAMMKAVLKQRRDDLAAREKAITKALPRGISKEKLSEDLFRLAENKADINLLRQEYGDAFIDQHVMPLTQWSRQTFDDMLGRANNVLQRNGFDPIPRRDNYITHILDEPSFWQKVGIGIDDLNPMGGSVSSDINPGRARGGVPDEIVGRTANTGARRKFNKFAQERKGNNHAMDFFAAHDAYYEPMLHNEFMTPAASRARVVERAFRSNDKAKDLQREEFAQIVGASEAKKQMVRNRNNKNYEDNRRSPFVMAWQEYGNMLAGKTNAWDRNVIDTGGKGGEMFLNASTKLQGITGASSIPGSTTAALAQVLSLPQTIARDSPRAVLKAAKDMMLFEGKFGGPSDPLRKSAFMRARYTDAESQRLSPMRKYTKAASIPMQAIERFSGELSWRSAYHKAKQTKGISEQEAIDTADLAAKKTLAGRGIGDRPLAMNSKALGAITQFGLEVNNMRVQFWKDFTPWQKAKFLIAAAALNQVYQGVTGNAPLPDYIGAISQTVDDFNSPNDDKQDTVGDNIGQGFQRIAGQTSKFIPGASTAAGFLMSDRQREEVFGKNSELSRFGTPALSKAVTTGFDVKDDLFAGKFWDAAKNIGSLLPTGAQAKRSVEGAEAAIQGYQTSSDGKYVTSVNDRNNPLTVPQALTFGKYSLPGQQQAMDSGFKLNEKESTNFKKLYAKDKQAATEYFNKRMKLKIDESNRKGSLTNTGTPAVASAAGMPKAPYGVQPTSNSSQSETSNVAKGTGYKDLLEEYDMLMDDERKDWNAQKNTDPAIAKSLKAWTGDKVDVKDITNELARKWAEYQRDFAEGKTTKITQDKRKREILKDALGASMDETEKTIIQMSKEKLESYIDSGDVTAKQLEKVLAVERARFDAGVIDQETFAKKLGFETARGYKTKKTGKGGRKGGRKAAVSSFKIPGAETQSTRLRGAAIARNAGLGK